MKGRGGGQDCTGQHRTGASGPSDLSPRVVPHCWQLCGVPVAPLGSQTTTSGKAAPRRVRTEAPGSFQVPKADGSAGVPAGASRGPGGDWPPRGPMSLGFRSRGGSGDTSPSHGPPHSLVCCDAGEGRGSGDEGAGEAGWEEECSSLRPSFASLSQSEPHDAACPSHELGKRSGRLGASERPVNRCLRRIRRRA